MKEKIYTDFPTLEKDFREQELKHAKLVGLDGKAFVSFNIQTGKQKMTLNAKLDEIKRRLNHLPEGCYIIIGQHRFGTGVNPVLFYYGKGNYEVPTEKPVLNKEAMNENSKNLLSVETAMSNIKESATYKAENANLVRENEDLKKRNAELENQVLSLQESLDEFDQEEEGNGLAEVGNYFKELMPVLAPLADRFFDLQERKYKIEEAKTLMEGGYDLPGLKKRSQVKQKRNQEQKEIPAPGTEGWNEYIEYLCALDENNFEAHLEQLKQANPDIYNSVVSEVYEEGEMEEEENEEEENN